MKLVIGLGNPGRRYQQTRHNVGFAVAQQLTNMVGGDTPRTRFEGELVEGSVDGTKVGLLCPMTYMNASGQSVRKAVDFYKLNATDILVVCDDLNLSLGRLRIRAKGSAGGQKGLADIIRHLGTDQFPRLRIGIDPAPPGWAVPDYVLGKFKPSELPTIEDAIQQAALAAADWVQHGTEFCMNRYNASANSN
ncbi:aminoacyl-tRNA hydrolase [Roseimaritima ulvae]|uniref:Peptidyl-tRNA hydrolase n=1 Tax=Roseimaritima ulvae TaxID=980254 RepID=A0A5B9QR48_9BACT|nr:aminoacyl-tRNA hydrolase [Roseimaritima ulvae]QEG39895.1 Peptidyl-tRNA hydrolase [Roseimaritima ulvae]